jgi:hypothetical protein
VDDSTKTIIKVLGVAAGAWLLYQWLNSSGLWGQWFGGNSFSTSAELLSYCQANPSGSATYNGQTATCAQWMAAAGQSSTAAPATTTTTATAPAATTASIAPAAGSTFVPRLQAAAIANPSLGSDSANVSQWNFLLAQMWPSAPQIGVTTPAGNNAISASAYVGFYLAQGYPDPTMPGGTSSGVSGIAAYQEDPYAWGKPN